MTRTIRLLGALTLLFFLGCSGAKIRDPDCNPGEVLFETNTHESAFIKLEGNLSVPRIAIYIYGANCEKKTTNLVAYFAYGKLYLCLGEWEPNPENTKKGRLRNFHKIASFNALFPSRAYEDAECFILNKLMGTK